MNRTAYIKRWRIENRAKMLEGQKRWRENNRSAWLANARNWKIRNPEKHSAHVKAAKARYLIRHREKVLHDAIAGVNLRRAQIACAIADAEGVKAMIKSARSAPFQLCRYCGIKASGRSLCFDHVIPLSRGGSHTPSNLVPACRPCNSSKNNKLISEWRPNIQQEIEEFLK